MTAFEAHDLEMKGALTSLARRLGDLSIAMNEGDSAVRRDLPLETCMPSMLRQAQPQSPLDYVRAAA